MRSTILLASLLSALAAVGFAPPRSAPVAGDATAAGSEGRESLQQFLARMRRQRDSVLGEMRNRVEELCATLEQQAGAREPDTLVETRKKLVELGAESAPLLVEKVDPGSEGSDAVRLRAAYVTQALVQMPTRAITARLIELARSGSPEGKLNALRVLATNPEPERVAPVLVEIYRASHGEQRTTALAALARVGGPESEAILAEALADPSPEIVQLTLQALATARNVAIAPKIGALLAATRDAVRTIDGFLAYYRACPEVIDKTTLLGLVRLAQDFSASTDARIRVLDTVPLFAERADVEVKKELRTLAESPTREIREAGLSTLVLLGDKNARRDLLAEYDEQIEKNKNWGQYYEARANVLYRIADYRDALKDYAQALKLSADDIRARTEGAWLGVARCNAQLGKYKEAAQALEKAPLSIKQLSELASDPAFVKMAKEPKHKGLFHLE